MPRFYYQARQAGQLTEGEIEAPDQAAAVSALSGRGLIPIQVGVRAESAIAAIDWEAVQERLGLGLPQMTDLILFSRQMYALTRAGVPLIQGLLRLAESTANVRLAKTLRQVVVDLESGRSLAASLARHPRLFSPLYVNMVRVGEEAGSLEEAFLRLYEYLDRDKLTVDRIKAALRYPTFVVIAISIAIGILTMFVIPAFAKVFGSFQMELPLPTKIILGVSHFASTYWYVVIGGVVAAIAGFKFWLRTESGRLTWDRISLRFPVVGSIVLRATIARFARAFTMATRAGVPITQAISAVALAVDNQHLAHKLGDMRMGIERGETVLRTAAATALFTPITLQMIAVGEETGQIDQMLEEVADFYDREVEYDVANLSAAIEPILTVAVGGIVLVLALGVFLPMWDLTQLASRGR